MRRRATNGRLAAWAGIVLGGGASVAANLAHALYVQADPNPVTVIGAVFWPVCTLIGFEVIVRPTWPTKGWSSAPWWSFRVAAVAVGVVAVVSSYQNMSDLMFHENDSWFAAHYGPVAIDGLMITSAGALLAIERSGSTRSTRPDRPATLTAHPIRSVAWSIPDPIRLPDPIDSIEQTIRSTRGVRSASIGSTGARSTATVPDPIDPTRSSRTDPIGPAPIGVTRSDRPTPLDRIDWTTRSAIDPAGASSRSVEALLADIRAALGPGDPIPSAESIRAHYRIGPTKARSLRDALRTDRSQPGAGGADREIN